MNIFFRELTKEEKIAKARAKFNAAHSRALNTYEKADAKARYVRYKAEMRALLNSANGLQLSWLAFASFNVYSAPSGVDHEILRAQAIEAQEAVGILSRDEAGEAAEKLAAIYTATREQAYSKYLAARTKAQAELEAEIEAIEQGKIK